MERNHLIKLTLGVYKVTELFPKQEALKFQIRERANEILAGLLSNPENKDALLRDIEAINVFFDIALSQNWVHKKNLTILKQEYETIAQGLGSFREAVKEDFGQKKEGNPSTAPDLGVKKDQTAVSVRMSAKKRHERLISLLNYKKGVRLSELKKLFPQISPRTIRRDMELLIKQGIVSRKRDGQKDVAYQLIESGQEEGVVKKSGHSIEEYGQKRRNKKLSEYNSTWPDF